MTITKTLVLLIEYDGTDYSGWQIQPNGRTIQEEIEKALRTISGQKLRVTGSGRTDAGVHASGQVASISLEDKFNIEESKIHKALNANLPGDIRILKAKLLDRQLNARFDAISREYRYSLITEDSVFEKRFSGYIKYPLDIDELLASAPAFTGRHDFTTFSKHNPDTGNYICNITKCDWQRVNNFKFELTIRADRFVYGMVRSIVGAMIESARGKFSPSDIREMINSSDRSLCPPLAPASGLRLSKIEYNETLFDD